MEWSSELREIRRALDDLRRERERQAKTEEAELQQRNTEIKNAFQSLQIQDALQEMNRQLLDGQGELEIYAPGELATDDADEGEEELEDDGEIEEVSDTMSAVLTWEEGGASEIAVDMGMTLRGIYLEVNGTEIRLDHDALKRALIRAFSEEVGL